jgi:lipid II isoglutaminyl synthase (glutamine-hydrolysing)
LERRVLTLLHLYPDVMSLYGDRGNVLALRRRCEWRGIGVCVEVMNVGDECDFGSADILFMGGGQDKAQASVAEDLQRIGHDIRLRVAEGVVALTICGGFQLFGKRFVTAGGRELPGIGVFDVETDAGKGRLVGDVVLDTDVGHEPWLRSPASAMLVGFENHSGLTHLGRDATPLGRVVHGFGNTAEGAYEGVVYRNAVGTYLHGSLLPKNPWFADCLIARALAEKYGDDTPLAPLDDALEYEAQAHAIGRCTAA